MGTVDHGRTGEHCHTHIIPRLKKVSMETIREGSRRQWAERRGGFRTIACPFAS
jgi:diadenosine tetraphosphate (Ap4A) HIT family hydrolase